MVGIFELSSFQGLGLLGFGEEVKNNLQCFQAGLLSLLTLLPLRCLESKQV